LHLVAQVTALFGVGEVVLGLSEPVEGAIGHGLL